jgi:hypothetical protein
MPLRDHFRPPVSKKSSWQGFHAMWPTCIVRQFRNELPPGFVAEPRVQTQPPHEYEYEVRVFDAERDRQLVAAIEFVSPANKDRPDSRDAFVAKCAALLRRGVAVSVIDLVTVRRFNLYAQLMVLLGHPDPTMSIDDPAIYAASGRWVTKSARARLEAWSHTLVVDEPLPTLPLWLSEVLVVPLNLEQSYEQTCHDLWIT